ncbi:ABC transporter permease [Shewanella benthica]|uniref:ABC transporter permease n=1 Tax=Shewanella benthica TaxID=43661 RepID=UPI00187A3110|nr:ABC transporter permease [Shewanella benthica]MBE7213909.1 ABC transporter permease [Shewanella benthica]MCL1061815.1 ABC transporter permease [Shewanella benthica]
MTQIIKRNNWAIWRDVIFALFVREIRTGFNDKFGLAWSIVNPVAFIFILSYMRGRMDGGETHTVPTFVFMMYGMLLIQFFLEVMSGVSGSINKNKPLFAFRQVQPISSMLAVSLFQTLVKLFVFVVILVIMYFLKMEVVIADPIRLMINFFLVGLLGFSLGGMFAIAICFVPEFKKIQSMLTRPLFFISAVFFSLQDIPAEHRYLFDWNPILHAIELSRYAAYPSYGSVGVSESYLIESTIVLTFFSLACYYSFWKQAISR